MGFAEVKFDKTKSKFFLMSDDIEAAYIDVTIKEHSCFLDYAYVNPSFRGQGLGEKIVLDALQILSQQNLKPVPVCGYVKSLFTKLNLK